MSDITKWSEDKRTDEIPESIISQGYRFTDWPWQIKSKDGGDSLYIYADSDLAAYIGDDGELQNPLIAIVSSGEDKSRVNHAANAKLIIAAPLMAYIIPHLIHALLKSDPSIEFLNIDQLEYIDVVKEAKEIMEQIK